MIYNATAIILRRWDHGEWDRLYTAYTRAHGKLTLIAKGTRRSKAKLTAHLEPYSEVDLVIARGRTMDRVTFARVLDHGYRFAVSWEDATTAAYGVECVDRLTRDAHSDPAVFDLLREYLAATPHSSPSRGADPPPARGGARGGGSGEREVVGATDVAALRSGFVLRLLVLLGYAPALDRCLDCREPFAPVVAFGSPERGGILCHQCRPSGRSGMMLGVQDREQLRAGSAQLRADPQSSAAATFVDALLEQHLVAPLRTSLAVAHLTGETAARTMAGS